MAGRLAGKRAVVTDCNEYNGADIVKLFREEDAGVFAVDRDLTVPSAADDLLREVWHVDILIANLAYPHKYAPAHEKSDEEMEYGMQRLYYPLHRLTRAVLPQMLERKRGKIVVVGSADSLRGRRGGVALYGGARGAQHGYMKHVSSGFDRDLRVGGRPPERHGGRRAARGGIRSSGFRDHVRMEFCF
jgi:2-keto-3-deoxy-L-fuconate dehydrogenase